MCEAETVEVLTAPFAGTVTGVLVHMGDTVVLDPVRSASPTCHVWKSKLPTWMSSSSAGCTPAGASR